MPLTGKYIYCFIKEDTRKIFINSTISNVVSSVYSLPYKDISAIVSDTNITEIDPTRKNLRAHQHVITAIMKNYVIIPVAFGTVGSSKENVVKMIADNYNSLLEHLEYFKNKVEVGLRAVWKDDYFTEDIENADIKFLKEKVSGKDENEVLMDKVQLGKLVKQATINKRDEYLSAIYEPLVSMAVDSNYKEELPLKTVFSANFLVKESDSDAFDKAVEKLCQPFEKRLDFSYTGPWPPYNFVSLKLNTDADDKG